jgi:hypothetical protein
MWDTCGSNIHCLIVTYVTWGLLFSNYIINFFKENLKKIRSNFTNIELLLISFCGSIWQMGSRDKSMEKTYINSFLKEKYFDTTNLIKTSASMLSKYLTTCVWPCSAAWNNAVWPCLSIRLILALFCKNNRHFHEKKILKLGMKLEKVLCAKRVEKLYGSIELIL